MKKGDKRKQDITREAKRLFFKKGYENVSINDIMLNLNITKGSFYHHFESKQDVLFEIAKEQVLSAFEAYMFESRDRSANEKLESLLYYLTPFRQGEEDFLAAILALFKKQEGQMIFFALEEEYTRLFYPELLEILKELSDMGYAYFSLDSLPMLLFKTQLSYQQLLIEEALNFLSLAETIPGNCLKLLQALRFLWQRSLSLPYDALSIIEIDELLKVLKTAYDKMQGYLPIDLHSIQTRFNLEELK